LGKTQRSMDFQSVSAGSERSCVNADFALPSYHALILGRGR